MSTSLPARSIVLPSQAVTHRDPRFWPDAGPIRPGPLDARSRGSRPKFAFFPFGGGPRVCIGEQFAWMEGVLLLATIGQQWRLRLAPGQVVATQPIVTLRPRHGMRMQVESRV